MQPFLKVEADALLSAGYKDIGWREVSSAAFGVPNPKHHVILMATAKETGVVDSCLFSTVGLLYFAVVFCCISTLLFLQNTVCFCCSDVETYILAAGGSALRRLYRWVLPVWGNWATAG
jgi:hypothetical protein